MSVRRGIAAMVVATVARAPLALGQCDGMWLPGDGVAGLGGSFVYGNLMTVWDPDGAGPRGPELVVAGAFTVAGTSVAQNIATWDGTTWRPLGGTSAGAAGNAPLTALVTYNGDLYAGVGDGLYARVFRWTGQAWQGVAGLENGNINALTVFNGELIAGGHFQLPSVSPTYWYSVARWDGSAWLPLARSSDSTGLRALCVSGGLLIAGGSSYSIGGVEYAGHVAAWNGSEWRALGTGVDADSYALIDDNGTVVVGGDFTHAGGLPANHIARWDGTSWSAIGAGTTASVRALAATAAGLLAGGNFQDRVLRWDGTTWSSLGAAPDSGVTALGSFQGAAMVAGYFSHVGGVHARGIARWDGAWSSLGSGTDAPVRAATFHDGDLYVGGDFTYIGGQPAQRMARWNGAQWHGIGGGMNAPVRALAEFAGDVVAGGEFLAAGSALAAGAARWDGSQWQGLGSGVGPRVNALVEYNGELVAGGSITHAGVPVANLASWNGYRWNVLGDGVDGEVYALAVYDGELIVGGRFQHAGGLAARFIARWDGESWHPFAGELLPNSSNGNASAVFALAVFNGNLFAGGDFALLGEPYAGNVARWDGTEWRSTGEAPFSGVGAMSVYQGRLFVAGSTLSPPPPALSWGGIAGWTGNAWRPAGLGISTGGGSGFLATMATDNRVLVVGGSFVGSGNLISSNLARWIAAAPVVWAEPASVRACGPSAAEFHVQASGTPAPSYRWRRVGQPLTDGPQPGGSVAQGAATPDLRLSNLRASDAGWYDCLITNSCGDTGSIPASLSVCVADYDCNGATEPADVARFVNVWYGSFSGGTLAGDFDGNGLVQPADVAAFVADWLAALTDGC